MKNSLGIYIADLLSAYVGGNGLPIKEAARALGVSESLVYQHRTHENAGPTIEQLFTYMRILPASFGNAILRPAGLAGAYHPDSISGCKFKAVLHGMARTGETFHHMSDAAKDGMIDHMEERSLPPHLYAAASVLNAVAHHIEVSA